MERQGIKMLYFSLKKPRLNKYLSEENKQTNKKTHRDV